MSLQGPGGDRNIVRNRHLSPPSFKLTAPVITGPTGPAPPSPTATGPSATGPSTTGPALPGATGPGTPGSDSPPGTPGSDSPPGTPVGGPITIDLAATGPAPPPLAATGPAPPPPGATGPAPPPLAATGPAPPPAATGPTPPPPAATGPTPPPPGATGPTPPPPGATGPTPPPPPPGATGPSVATVVPIIQPTTSMGPHIFVVIGTEAFDLSASVAEPILGGPNVLERTDFNLRFRPNPSNPRGKALYDVVVKYWRTETILGKSKSVTMPTGPKPPGRLQKMYDSLPMMEGGGPDIFRIPCIPGDIELLKEAFNNYKQFLQSKIDELKTESSEKSYWTIQRDYVIRYLEALNGPINKNTCIDAAEAIVVDVDKPAGKPSDGTDYYAIIPKVFYLLYTNAKQRVPLVTKDIFDRYPSLGQNAKEYMNQLLTNTAGPFEGDRGIYDMATGVVEIFYLLPKLFPDLYGHLIPDRKSVEDLAKKKAGLGTDEKGTSDKPGGDKPGPLPDIKGTLLPILDKFKGLPGPTGELIIAAIENALKAYSEGKMDEALAQIAEAFTKLQGYIDELLLHTNKLAEGVASTVQAYNDLQAKRIKALTGTEKYDGDLSKIIPALSSLADLETDPAKKERFQTLLSTEAALDDAIIKAKARVVEAEKKLADATSAASSAATGATGPTSTGTNEALEKAKAELAEVTAKLAAAQADHAELEKAKARITELEAQLAKAVADLEAALAAGGTDKTGLEAAQAKVAELTAALEAAKAEDPRIKTLETELAAAKQALLAAQASLKEAQDALAKGTDTDKAALAAADARIAALTAQVQAAEAARAEIESRLTALQAELEALRKEKNKVDPNTARYRKERDAARAAIEALKASQTGSESEKQAEIDRLLALLKELEGELDKAKVWYDAHKGDETMIATLQGQLAAAQQELAAARAAQGEGNGNIAELEAKVRELESQIAAAMRKQAEDKATIDRLRADRNAWKAKAEEGDDHEQHIGQLESELAAVKAALEAAQSRLPAGERDHSDLVAAQAQIKDLLAQVQKLSDDLSRIRAEREGLKGQLAAEQQKNLLVIDDLERRLREAAANLAKAQAASRQGAATQAEVAAAEDQVRSLQAELDEANKLAARYRGERDAAKAEIERLSAQLRDALSKADSVIKGLQGKGGQTEQALAQSAADLAALRKRLADADAMTAKLRQERDAARQEAAQADQEAVSAIRERDEALRRLAAAKSGAEHSARDVQEAMGAAAGMIQKIAGQRDDAIASKKRLYADISQHIQGLMREIGQQAVQLRGLGNLASAQKLGSAMSASLNQPLVDGVPVAGQANIQTFERGIDTLLRYLTDLDQNYSRWVAKFEGDLQDARRRSPPQAQLPQPQTQLPQPYRPPSPVAQLQQSPRGSNSWSQGSPEEEGDFKLKINFGKQTEVYTVSVRGSRSQANTESGFIDKVRKAFEPTAVKASPNVDWKRQLRTYLEGQKIALTTLQAAIDRLIRSNYRIEYMYYDGDNAATDNGYMPQPGQRPVYRGGATNMDSIPKPIRVSPDDLSPIVAEQSAWEDANDAYNAIEPEYQSLLPEPSDPAPISSLVEPFNKYIEENAEDDPLEEARSAVGMLSPEQVEKSLADVESPELEHITPLYEKALPRVGKAWIPIMVRADMLKNLLE